METRVSRINKINKRVLNQTFRVKAQLTLMKGFRSKH